MQMGKDKIFLNDLIGSFSRVENKSRVSKKEQQKNITWLLTCKLDFDYNSFLFGHWSPRVALKLMIPLPQPPECWDTGASHYIWRGLPAKAGLISAIFRDSMF